MNQHNPAAAATDKYKLKDTTPQLGERWLPSSGIGAGGGPGVKYWAGSGIYGDHRPASTYDLVEQMHYLFVRVVKAKDLPPGPLTGSVSPYVEVKLGNYKGTTKHFDRKNNPEWNQVFAFSKDSIQSISLEVFVRDTMAAMTQAPRRAGEHYYPYIGKVVFDLNEIPTRVPPDSPLAPQWYRLIDSGDSGGFGGDVMLAVWMGEATARCRCW